MVPVLLLFLVMLNQTYAPFRSLPGGLDPDLALIVAMYGGLTYPLTSATALGFGVGLLQDTLAGGLTGIGALSKGLTGLVWVRLWRQVMGDVPLMQLPLLAALTVVDGAAFFGTSVLLSAHAISWGIFPRLLAWQLLSNLLFGPFLLMLFAAMAGRLRRTKRSGWRRHESALTFQRQ